MDIGPQTHKTHRGAGDRGGKAQKRRDLAAKTTGPQGGYHDWRAYIGSSHSSTRQALQRRATMEQLHLHRPEVNRVNRISPAPAVVAVVGPPQVGKSTLIRDLVRYYTNQDIKEPIGPITVVANRKRRVTLMEVPNDLPAMIDAAKVADLVLLLIDASFGLEMETFEFLNVVYAHGMCRMCGVLTHMDGFQKESQMRAARRRLKHRLWEAVNKGCKLFSMGGLTPQAHYPHNDVHQLARFLADSHSQDTQWRKSHAHVLVDRLEVLTPAEVTRVNPRVDRDIALYGYLRGIRLPACADGQGGQRFHLPGVGDFTAYAISEVTDPAPLPSAEKAAGAGKMTARDRVLFAPMSNVGRVSFSVGGDGRQTFISLNSKHAIYSLDEAERQARGIEPTAGEQMLLDLQLQRGDASMTTAVQPVARQRRRVEFDDGLDDADEAALDAAGIEADSDDGSASSEEAPRTRRAALSEQARMKMAHGAALRGEVFNEAEWLGGGSEADDVGGLDAVAFVSSDDGELGLGELLRLEAGEDVDVDALNWLEERDSEPEAEAADETALYVQQAEQEEEPAPESASEPSSPAEDAVARADAQLETRLARVSMHDVVYGAVRAEGEEDDDDVSALALQLREVNADDTYRSIPQLIPLEQLGERCSARWGSAKGARLGLEGDARAINAAFAGGDGAGAATEPAAREDEGTAVVVSRSEAADASGDGSAYDLARDAVRRTEMRNEAIGAALGADAVAVGGLPTGTYVRIELHGVPAELCVYFDGRNPLLAGAINPGEDAVGFIHCRVKRHRWHRKVLKSFDPLVVSVGWRRYETAPIYSIQDQNGRRRLLKYTPEHMHCFATFWGPAAPALTGLCAFRSLRPGQPGFRVALAGTILETLPQSPVVKKLKLVGTPLRIEKNTAFVQGMFKTPEEALRFVGAKLRTVSGIRGLVKRPVKAPPGVIRATFEDRCVLSDIIFLRSWFPVAPRRYCQPVFNLLMSPAERRLGWSGARTVGQLRYELGVAAPQREDSEYRPIERQPVAEPALHVPKQLKRALPYSERIQLPVSQRRQKARAQAQGIRLSQQEQAQEEILRHARVLASDRERKRQEAAAAEEAQREQDRLVEEARIRESRARRRAGIHRAHARIDAQLARRA